MYLRARYLQPTLGMFLSRDPWSGDVVRPGSMNGFNYTEGNPINAVDPSGRGPVHDTVVINFAFRDWLWPEYILPFTVPANKPSWARRGKRIDLVDLANFEIYEVEDDRGGYFPPGHGPDQINEYLDLLNTANKGIGWAFVNQWKPGSRPLKPISISLLDGLVDVDARLDYSPGVIVYKAQLNGDALRKLLTDSCLTSLMAMAGKHLADQSNLPPQSPRPVPVPSLARALAVKLKEFKAEVHSPLLDLLENLGILK